MSIICEMVIATQAESKQIASASATPTTHRRWPAMDVQGVDVAALSMLYAITLNRDWMESDLDRFPDYADSDEGPWVALIANDLVDRLAAADQKTRSGFAGAWAETEELAEWGPDDVAERLDEICRFAQQAKKAGKQLLLYVAL